MKETELPEETEELWFDGEPSYHLLTIERDCDGNIYLVAWAYGRSTVLFKFPPQPSTTTSQ